MRCKKCGREIVIMICNGKEERCDPEAVPYRYLENGTELLAVGGSLIRGTTYIGMSKSDGMAYRPHFLSCPARKK